MIDIIAILRYASQPTANANPVLLLYANSRGESFQLEQSWMTEIQEELKSPDQITIPNVIRTLNSKIPVQY